MTILDKLKYLVDFNIRYKKDKQIGVNLSFRQYKNRKDLLLSFTKESMKPELGYEDCWYYGDIKRIKIWKNYRGNGIVP